jgi:hypothetical protein
MVSFFGPKSSPKAPLLGLKKLTKNDQKVAEKWARNGPKSDPKMDQKIIQEWTKKWSKN